MEQTRVSAGGRVLAVVVWLIAVAVVALGARRWLPPLASAHGAGIDRMLIFTMFSVGGLIMVGHLALGYFLWRFGRQPRASSHALDFKTELKWALAAVFVMAVIAEGGVIVLGLPVWSQVFGQAAPPDALTVEVTTEQFAWNVRYAGPDGQFGRTDPKLITLENVLGRDPADAAGKDDIVDINTIRVVVNRPVKVRLKSKDVLHSFFLPFLRVKQDVVPGMTIEVWFTPTQTGVFELACAELCGLGHYEMRGVLIVQTPEEFEKWSKEQQNG